MYLYESLGTFDLRTLYTASTEPTQRRVRQTFMTADGAVLDLFGGAPAPPGEVVVRRRGRLAADSIAALDAAAASLLAMNNTVQTLRRRRLVDNSVQTATVRVAVEVGALRPGDLMTPEFDVSMTVLGRGVFYGEWVGIPDALAESAEWDQGGLWDNGLAWDQPVVVATLSAIPTVVAVTNPGNASNYVAVLRYKSETGTTTALQLAQGDANIKWTGSLAATKELVIDCGALSVTADGVADIDGLTLESGHAIKDWFPLLAGANSITATRTGGSAAATLRVEFRSAWVL